MLKLSNFVKKSALSMMLCLLYPSMNATAGQKIDAFYFDLSDPFIFSCAQYIKSEAKKMGAEVREYDGSFSVQKQEKQMTLAFMEKNAKVVNLVDPKLTAQFIEQARNNAARVVFFNRPIDKSLLKEYDQAWFVYNDSAECGRIQAHLISRYLKKHPEADRNGDGVINIVLVRGEPGNRDALLRSSNVLNSLAAQMVDYEKIAEFAADWSAEKAYNQMLGVISDYGLDDIEMVVSNNDAMALGVISALQQHGFNTGDRHDGYIPVFGVDAIPDAMTAIGQGTLTGTVLNDAETTAKIAVAIALGKENESDLLKDMFDDNNVSDGVINVPYKMISGIE